MKIKLIVAMDKNRGIGKNNNLMWHLPSDMRFFKETTLNQIVVMGRKNFDSIPQKYRPLPNRENVILTRQMNFEAGNCFIFNSVRDVILHYKSDRSGRDLFIIGGGQIYKQVIELDVVDEMFITHVNHIFDADTFFPKINLKDWKVETLFKKDIDDKNDYAFEVKKYVR
jgi:dihydrofolate reductase